MDTQEYSISVLADAYCAALIDGKCLADIDIDKYSLAVDGVDVQIDLDESAGSIDENAILVQCDPQIFLTTLEKHDAAR
jgi:hypothetical protein